MALSLITQIGNVKYYICETWEQLQLERAPWSGALCRVTNGTWYEWREYVDDPGSGTWEVYTGAPVALTVGVSPISESNPLPIKTSLLSATPVTIFNAISATPATPYEIVLAGTNIKEIKIQTSGTSTSRTMTFKAKLLTGQTAVPFMGLNWTDGSATLAVQTTGKDEIWSFSGFDGVYSLQFNVTAVAGGNFSVVSTVCS